MLFIWSMINQEIQIGIVTRQKWLKDAPVMGVSFKISPACEDHKYCESHYTKAYLHTDLQECCNVNQVQEELVPRRQSLSLLMVVDTVHIELPRDKGLEPATPGLVVNRVIVSDFLHDSKIRRS